jgi:hypothetical protein
MVAVVTRTLGPDAVIRISYTLRGAILDVAVFGEVSSVPMFLVADPDLRTFL